MTAEDLPEWMPFVVLHVSAVPSLSLDVIGMFVSPSPLAGKCAKFCTALALHSVLPAPNPQHMPHEPGKMYEIHRDAMVHLRDWINDRLAGKPPLVDSPFPHLAHLVDAPSVWTMKRREDGTAMPWTREVTP